jgi:lysophospholipase L1-like esterase
MKLNFVFRTLCLWALGVLASAQENSFSLKDGDRVVFFGDSITDQRLYTTFTETYVVTRFPKLHIDFIHSGWGGDRVGGGGGGPIDVRLKRDVLAYQPTVMTVMLGMNDGSYRAFDQGIFDQYRTGCEHIVDSMKKAVPAIRITVIEPSPYDDVTKPPAFAGGYNAVLVRYGQFLKDLADREHLSVADLNAPVVADLEKAKAADPEVAKKIIPDRVHPGAAGHLLMAGELLKAWNAPSTVTAVEIDAREKKVGRAQSTQVTDLKGSDALAWVQKDAALPMPVDMKDPIVALAVNSSDFLQALNQQSLKISGLAEGTYKLAIDGSPVGEFTQQQLAEGINLAALSTPMQKQAMEVHRLTLQHNNLHFTRWRQIQVPMATFKADRIQSATKELMTALDEEEAGVVARQRAAAQPVEHRYELSPR